MSKKIMKKVSVFIGAVMASAIVFGGVSSANITSLKAENVKTDFSSKISAVSHANGQTVNILPEDLKLWNKSETFNADYLNGLYEYSSLHKDFVVVVNSSNSDLVDIYRQADAFNPVNNVLRWNSSLTNVESYTVRVAYDNKFTKCILKDENADIEKGVTIENPYVNTDYYWQVIATVTGGNKVYSPIFSFTTDDSIRTVTVEGVSNTRDIGGYETAYGYVKQGLVYRSARLESITDDGLDTLKNELGVKTDLDLRGTVEASTGMNMPNPASLENYYVYDTPQYALAGDLGIDSPIHYESIKNIMSVFTAEENYPIDIHCAVGRDRTGTVTALLKAVLGFAENDIINDYFTSMFATTGAWSKETTHTQQQLIMNVVSYLNSFEGDTLADRTANYLISKCGMSQDDIDAIRNIMTGKNTANEEDGEKIVIPMDNTFSDVDNYAGYSFVTFEKFAAAKVVVMVENGQTVEAPFAAGDGFVWTVGSAAYDFTTSVTEDITVKAVKANVCDVKIVSTGAVTAQETVTVAEGTAFDFATLEKAGYDFVVISEEGKVITELTVVGETTLNVIYTQR